MNASLQLCPLISGELGAELFHFNTIGMTRGASSGNRVAFRHTTESFGFIHRFVHIVAGIIAAMTSGARNSFAEVDILHEQIGNLIAI